MPTTRTANQTMMAPPPRQGSKRQHAKLVKRRATLKPLKVLSVNSHQHHPLTPFPYEIKRSSSQHPLDHEHPSLLANILEDSPNSSSSAKRTFTVSPVDMVRQLLVPLFLLLTI
jgi:hypothetical protein